MRVDVAWLGACEIIFRGRFEKMPTSAYVAADILGVVGEESVT